MFIDCDNNLINVNDIECMVSEDSNNYQVCFANASSVDMEFTNPKELFKKIEKMDSKFIVYNKNLFNVDDIECIVLFDEFFGEKDPTKFNVCFKNGAAVTIHLVNPNDFFKKIENARS